MSARRACEPVLPVAEVSAPTLAEIERLVQAHAKALAAVGAKGTLLDRVIRKARAARLPAIRQAIMHMIATETALRRAIGAAPHLFQRPRTLTLHGLQVGYAKGKGRLDWDDPDAVVARIRKYLPPDQAEALIRTTEAPIRDALRELPAATLGRLGVSLTADGDHVVIRPVDGEIDKLVKRLRAASSDEGEGDAG